MNIYMWSGPRNLSTALMRSFENRDDTYVWDEPLYAYYLNETKKNHPMAKEIIKKYETDIEKLITSISNKNIATISYQKHMTHHILAKTPIEWIKNGINCFLIRNPKEVILSYIKKNDLNSSNDIGFPMQKKIFELVKKMGLKTVVINSENLSSDPKKVLTILCKNLNIPFSNKMLNWPTGKRISDGIWEKVWYQNVQSYTNFEILKNNNDQLPNKYNKIYHECLEIFNDLNKYNIFNER